MPPNPFESLSETDANADEREVERGFIDRLDRKLAEIDPKKVLIFDKSGIEIATVQRIYVYCEKTEGFRSRTTSPEKREEIQGIYFQFTKDAKEVFGGGEYLTIGDFDFEGFEKTNYFQDYRSLLERIEGVKDRTIPEDAALKLLVQLDTARRDLHEKAALFIQRKLLGRYASTLISQKDAKKVFEVMYRIWDTPQNLEGLSYSEGALNGVDLKKVEERVLQETGAEINIRYFTYGWHANDPENQYEISFLKPMHPDVIPRVKKIIVSFITKKPTWSHGW